MKVVLYDGRKESGTFGEVNEYFLGEHNPILLQIPKYVFHGFKCISESEAMCINLPTETYKYDEPDEYRVDPHSKEIPYDWDRKDG
jgi:dTDP-4-dehydrorhamnose 3,5-epimerase